MMRNRYENPLASRYAGEAMNYNWSPRKKFLTWRRLWVELARAEQELGLAIEDEQLAELEAAAGDIDIEAAEAKERELRHDVMSHVHVFAEQCPRAAPIIHLGATSCFVGDNTDLVQLRDGLQILRDRLVSVMRALHDQADAWASLPMLGFTHFQPAQVTTLGKRLCLYLADFLMDLESLERVRADLPFRGVKGTTGTQASFLVLFDGDHEKVTALDAKLTEAMGFSRSVPVCGQTYSRKIDFRVLSVLAGIAQSASKMANDIRLLANRREVEEPFGSRQIGSSAMAYKRNPMRCERVCGLARFVLSLLDNPAQTHATQWLERTLDDSANRRLSLPEAFLAVDVILSTVENVAAGLQVWPNVIRRNLDAELPFMATENILMAAVRAGGDRQALHEVLRQHSMDAVKRVKEEGAANDLLERIAADPAFAAVANDLERIVDPAAFVGRAPRQVAEFLAADVAPVLQRLEPELATESEGVNV